MKIPIPARPLALSALAFLGLGSSAYLLYEHYVAPIVCIGQGCRVVDESIYSEIFGVPISVLGLMVYLAILGLSLARLRARNPIDGYLALAIYGLALSGTTFSAYLTYLEAAVIHAFCTWCVISAVIITVLLILAVLEVRPLLRPRP